MMCKKEFSQDGLYVEITLKEGYFFHPVQLKKKTKRFEIVNKKDVYQQINDHKLINIQDKYLENFDFSEIQNDSTPGEIQSILADRAFLENVSFKKADFKNCSVSFSGAIFGESPVDFSETYFEKGEVSFLNTQFLNSTITFQKARFGDCRVFFYETQFGDGTLSFKEIIFDGETISFERANFGNGDTDFSFAQFGANSYVDFSEAIFGNGLVNFGATLFSKNKTTNFIKTKFGEGNVNFQYSTFGNGDVNFIKAEFKKGDISFNGSQLGTGEFDFTEAKLGGGYVYFWNALIKSDWYLEDIQAEFLDFSGARIHGTISFLGADLKALVLNSTKITGRFYLSAKELKIKDDLESLDDIVNIQKQSSYKEKAEQFRLLKENFRALGQYGDEDVAYVQFKKNELYNEKQEMKKKWECEFKQFKSKYNMIPAYILILFWLKRYYYYGRIVLKEKIFQDIGLFGTNPKRVAKYMVKTIFVFAMIYYFFFLIGLPIIEVTPNCNWFDQIVFSIYHSVVTFLTIGYGDVHPSNILGILLSGIEGFTGVFLMSYFTVTFVRITSR